MEKIEQELIDMLTEHQSGFYNTLNEPDYVRHLIHFISTHAVGFAEWVNTEGYEQVSKGVWGEPYMGSDRYSTSDLYEHYLKYLKEKEQTKTTNNGNK